MILLFEEFNLVPILGECEPSLQSPSGDRRLLLVPFSRKRKALAPSLLSGEKEMSLELLSLEGGGGVGIELVLGGVGGPGLGTTAIISGPVDRGNSFLIDKFNSDGGEPGPILG